MTKSSLNTVTSSKISFQPDHSLKSCDYNNLVNPTEVNDNPVIIDVKAELIKQGLIIDSQTKTGEFTDKWEQILYNSSEDEVIREINRPLQADSFSLRRLAILLSDAGKNCLEAMAQRARNITLQRHGRVMSLFAPLYLSNYCINSCRYCGFHAGNCGQKSRLSIDAALQEVKNLGERGFQDILLVSSEDPQYINSEYLGELTRKIRKIVATVSVEIASQSFSDYQYLVASGVDGVTMFQETYDPEVYADYHPRGPKSDYAWRLQSPILAAQAGMRRIGLGVLLGLTDWRRETLRMAWHAHLVMRQSWRTKVNISFPRLRPANEVEAAQFPATVNDRELVNMIVALRLVFPDAGLVLSTRETAEFRDHVWPLGITSTSAGSSTAPGGYVKPAESSSQFDIADERSPQEVADKLRQLGLDLAWKDWDAGFYHNTN